MEEDDNRTERKQTEVFGTLTGHGVETTKEQQKRNIAFIKQSAVHHAGSAR